MRNLFGDEYQGVPVEKLIKEGDENGDNMISYNEFKNFIGETIKLDPVIINKDTSISEMLSFYMGKNTPERQSFIINNLKIDIDKV